VQVYGGEMLVASNVVALAKVHRAGRKPSPKNNFNNLVAPAYDTVYNCLTIRCFKKSGC
jgi:hypothetical protein